MMFECYTTEDIMNATGWGREKIEILVKLGDLPFGYLYEEVDRYTVTQGNRMKMLA